MWGVIIININEFEVLRFLCENKNSVTQRIIAESTGLSLGSVNKTLSNLRQSCYIDDNYHVTLTGLKEIECYKVQNAIILAAGMSTRFIPFSYEKPKGLTVVKGEVLIERQIKQLRDAGIDEIVIVLGHMMEKFLYLVDKFNVKIVVNNEYRYKNTHSSIYFAREYLKNSYICCADNYFPKSVFHKYEYHSLYSTLYMEGVWQGERGVTTNSKGLIIATNRPAADQWVMNGYAYFNGEFSNKFKHILEDMYNTVGSDGLYWEQVYAQHVEELPLYEKRYSSEQIMEFDSVAELEAFDPDYIKHNSIALTKNICSTLNCSPSDIHQIEPIKKGYTNQSFKFICNGRTYVYRNPGSISSVWIDRKSEKKALEIAKNLGVDDSYIYADETTGWKISQYINSTESFDFANPSHVEKLCNYLRTLYKSTPTCGKPMDYLAEAKKLLQGIKTIDEDAYLVCLEHLSEVCAVDEALKADNWPTQLVHNDLYEDNLLISDGKLYIIDWEYAGDSDIGYDLCKLFVKVDAVGADIDQRLSIYYGRKPSAQERHHIVGCAIVSFFYWYIWAVYMVKHGNDYSDLMLKYLTILRRYLKEF